MIRRYLLTKTFHGTAAEFREIGEPFCDKINFQRDSIMTADGQDVRWSRWQEIGGEIPPEAILIDTQIEVF